MITGMLPPSGAGVPPASVSSGRATARARIEYTPRVFTFLKHDPRAGQFSGPGARAPKEAR